MNINFSPLNFVSNIKKTNQVSNPIAFRSASADSFEKQDGELSAKQHILLIKEYDDKIADLKNKMSETRALRQKYDEEIRAEYAPIEEKLLLDKEKVRGTDEERYVLHKYQLCLENKYDKLVETCEPLREQEESYKAETEQIVQEREQLISRLNPNVASLTSPVTSLIAKRKLSFEHPEIILLVNLPNMEDNVFKSLWANNNYFVINKTKIGKLLDTSYEPNRENYKRLTKEDLLSYSQFAKEFGFDVKDLNRYIEEGFLELSTLKNLVTGEEEPVHVLDINNETNMKGIERYKKVSSLVFESPYIKRDYLPAKYLAKLGFGSVEELENYTRTKKLTGKIMPLKTSDGITNELFIYCKNGAEGELKYLRNKNKDLATVQEFAALANMSETEVEDAIINGEIKVVPHYIYESDKYKVFINLKNKINSNFVNKKA